MASFARYTGNVEGQEGTDHAALDAADSTRRGSAIPELSKKERITSTAPGDDYPKAGNEAHRTPMSKPQLASASRLDASRRFGVSSAKPQAGMQGPRPRRGTTPPACPPPFELVRPLEQPPLPGRFLDEQGREHEQSPRPLITSAARYTP